MSTSTYCIVCGKALSEDDHFALLPCEDIIHCECYNKLVDNKCPYCKKKVNNTITLETCKMMKNKDKKYKKLYFNMIGVSKKFFTKKNSILLSALRFPEVLRNLYIFSQAKSIDEMFIAQERLFNSFNLNVKYDKNKLNEINKKNKKLIIIANHHSYLDALILNNLFRCGGIAASFIKDSPIFSNVLTKVGSIFIDRSKKGNTVQKVKEYFKKKNNNRLIIFPEGTITSKYTIAQFRSGAFNVGIPILPIVIKYDKYIYPSENIMEGVLSIISHNEINVQLHFLDVEYPPFNKEKVNKIRMNISKKGKFCLTNLTSKGAKK
jgi:1-acyl-sn-glycerol-3-phosphate acyltransferase